MKIEAYKAKDGKLFETEAKQVMYDRTEEFNNLYCLKLSVDDRLHLHPKAFCQFATNPAIMTDNTIRLDEPGGLAKWIFKNREMVLKLLWECEPKRYAPGDPMLFEPKDGARCFGVPDECFSSETKKPYVKVDGVVFELHPKGLDDKCEYYTVRGMKVYLNSIPHHAWSCCDRHGNYRTYGQWCK